MNYWPLWYGVDTVVVYRTLSSWLVPYEKKTDDHFVRITCVHMWYYLLTCVVLLSHLTNTVFCSHMITRWYMLRVSTLVMCCHVLHIDRLAVATKASSVHGKFTRRCEPVSVRRRGPDSVTDRLPGRQRADTWGRKINHTNLYIVEQSIE